MSEPLSFVADRPGRADRVVGQRFPGASRRRLSALFRDGAIKIDGRRARKGDAVVAGAVVVVDRAPAVDADLHPRPIEGDLDVVFADDHVVAVNKPAGLASHPLRAGEIDTVANLIVARFPECVDVGEDPREAGLAHRLDRGTSGLLLAARDSESWAGLRTQFGAGAVEKSYLALVEGAIEAPGGSDQALATRAGRAVALDIASADSLPATTRWRPLRRVGRFTLVEVAANTGRTHQVRAHLAAAGSPVAGDVDYGAAAMAALPRSFLLHADRLALRHPATGEPLELEAELPAAERALLDQLSA